jgi:hypothetical protein
VEITQKVQITAPFQIFKAFPTDYDPDANNAQIQKQTEISAGLIFVIIQMVGGFVLLSPLQFILQK